MIGGFYLSAKLETHYKEIEAATAQKMRSDAESAQEAARLRDRDEARRRRPYDDLQKQIAQRSFTEDINAPGFHEEWQRVYQRIFSVEDDYDNALRYSRETGLEVSSRRIKEAEDDLQRVMHEWWEAHRDGPQPNALF